MACTEQDLLAWLPGAVGGAPLQAGTGEARVDVGKGALQLRWQVLPVRRIALIALPRLAVRFDFDEGVAEDERQRFMRRFDLYMQRGGG